MANPQQLYDLARIVDHYGSKKPTTIFNSLRKSPALGTLYHGILGQKFERDEDAARESLGLSAQSLRYHTLKSRLHLRMLNTLFHLNLKKRGYSQYAQRLYSLHRRLFWVRILLLMGARPLAIPHAKHALKLAESIDATRECEELLEFLRADYALGGDKQKFEEIDARLMEVSRRRNIELQVSGMYQRLVGYQVRNAYPSSEVAALARRSLDASEELLSMSAPPSSAVLDQFRIRFFANMFSNDPMEALRTCDSALEWVQGRMLGTNAIAEFATHKFDAAANAGDRVAAITAYQLALSNYREGSNNWFVLQEKWLIFLMHELDFDNASEALQSLYRQSRSKSVAKSQLDRLHLMERYLDYARWCQTHTSPWQQPLGLSALETTIERSDKSGVHISWLIIQIVAHLEQGHFTYLGDNLERIKKYYSRYLRLSRNTEASVFLQLFTALAQAGFAPAACKATIERLENRLDGSARKQGLSDFGQILPYRYIWQLMLERLNLKSLDPAKLV